MREKKVFYIHTKSKMELFENSGFSDLITSLKVDQRPNDRNGWEGFCADSPSGICVCDPLTLTVTHILVNTEMFQIIKKLKKIVRET